MARRSWRGNLFISMFDSKWALEQRRPLHLRSKARRAAERRYRVLGGRVRGDAPGRTSWQVVGDRLATRTRRRAGWWSALRGRSVLVPTVAGVRGGGAGKVLPSVRAPDSPYGVQVGWRVQLPRTGRRRGAADARFGATVSGLSSAEVVALTDGLSEGVGGSPSTRGLRCPTVPGDSRTLMCSAGRLLPVRHGGRDPPVPYARISPVPATGPARCRRRRVRRRRRFGLRAGQGRRTARPKFVLARTVVSLTGSRSTPPALVGSADAEADTDELRR